MSITVVEMPARRSGPGARSGLRESGCGWCGALVRRDGAATLTSTRPLSTLALHRECRHAILFVSRLADTGTAMELPTVPRTSDVIAVETAFAERPTDVVADIRHRTELSVLERDRNGGGLRLATLQRGSREGLRASDVSPSLFIRP